MNVDELKSDEWEAIPASEYKRLKRDDVGLVNGYTARIGFKHFKRIKKLKPYIKLEGEAIEDFEKMSKIKEIILLGEFGAIRRITLRDEDENKKN